MTATFSVVSGECILLIAFLERHTRPTTMTYPVALDEKRRTVCFGFPWGQTRRFVNRLSENTNAVNGFNWVVGELPPCRDRGRLDRRHGRCLRDQVVLEGRQFLGQLK